VLKAAGVRISMDGKGRWIDNVFIEHLWRTVKYEQIYCMPTGTGVKRGSSCRPSLRFTTAGVCTRRSTTARQTKCISQLAVVGWLQPPGGIRWPRRASETRIQPMPRAGLAAYDVGVIGWLPRRTMIKFPPPVHFDVRGEAERAVRRIAKCSVFKCDASGYIEHDKTKRTIVPIPWDIPLALHLLQPLGSASPVRRRPEPGALLADVLSHGSCIESSKLCTCARDTHFPVVRRLLRRMRVELFLPSDGRHSAPRARYWPRT